MVIAMIRDMIKSVLRGVSDFTKYPDNVDEDGNHTSWYPDPKEHQRRPALQCLQPRSLRLVRPCPAGLLGLRLLRG